MPAPAFTQDVSAAAAALREGRLVAFPTETVYGLGADAANADALAALYRLKNRPAEHPVIVHLADFAAAGEWAADIPAAAQTLAQKFMPGALTLLLPRRADIAAPPAAGGQIALRVPVHPLAHGLLREFGGGVAAPSANRFGGVSPTCTQHVADEFCDQGDLLILDGGGCAIGIESTIVGFQDEKAFIARPGGISAEMIEGAGVALAPAPDSVRAPGALANHYAPHAPLYLVAEDDLPRLLADAPPAGVLSRQRPQGAAAWRPAAQNARQYAHNLYRHLRALDSAAPGRILVARPPDTPDWRAVNDRLRRAATAEK